MPCILFELMIRNEEYVWLGKEKDWIDKDEEKMRKERGEKLSNRISV